MTNTPVQAPSGRQFRRAALAAGAIALAALTAGLLMGRGPDVDRYLWLGLVAVVAAFLTTHLLVRMWRTEEFVASRRAAPGRRLATAFELLLAAGIVTNLVPLSGFAVVSGTLWTAALASFLAAVALALPRP